MTNGRDVLEGVYPPQQFYDQHGMDTYTIYTGSVAGRTAILDRITQADDPTEAERKGETAP